MVIIVFFQFLSLQETKTLDSYRGQQLDNQCATIPPKIEIMTFDGRHLCFSFL